MGLIYHDGMTVPYESTGRVGQKARTREALLRAVRQLLAAGEIPTVEGAAAAAQVSRTTAYRYFPNLHALLVAAHPHAEEESLLGEDPPGDPAERLRIVAESQTARILEFEAEMRAVLRLSLDVESPQRPALPMNRGLRIGWIEDALRPLEDRWGEQELRQLVCGIGATLGIEAFVWLTDIAGLSREESAETMRLNAERLLRSALNG
jgi:AcrR family transcriptional regulator